MGDAVLEREGIDEGFQGRSRGAQGLGHVDGPGPLAIHVVGAAHLSPHLAGGVVDGQDGQGELGAEPLDALPGKLLQAGLQARVDGQPMAGLGRPLRYRRLGRVGGEHGEETARLGHGLRLGGLGLRSRDDAAIPRPVEHAIAGLEGDSRRAVGAARLGGLRQRHEKRGLREGQALRLAPEIGEARRPRALKIAAIGRKCEIEPKDLVLREAPLELNGPHHLPELRPHAALVPGLKKPRHLHGERRAAGDHLPLPEELRRGAQKRQGINATMPLEPRVLVGLEHGQIARVHVPCFDRKPPAPLRGCEGAEQPPVPVEHHRRAAASTCQVEGAELLHVAPQGEARDKADGKGRGENEASSASPTSATPIHHGLACTTSTVP